MSCGGVGTAWLPAQALRGAGLGGLAAGRGTVLWGGDGAVGGGRCCSGALPAPAPCPSPVSGSRRRWRCSRAVECDVSL